MLTSAQEERVLQGGGIQGFFAFCVGEEAMEVANSSQLIVCSWICSPYQQRNVATGMTILAVEDTPLECVTFLKGATSMTPFPASSNSFYSVSLTTRRDLSIEVYR